MTAILYIILGLSLGVGLTLIYLQEKFIQERRLLEAMGESERIKSAKMLKDLDEQWENSCSKYKQEIAEYKQQIEQLNGTGMPPADITPGPENGVSDTHSQARLAELEEKIRFKDEMLTELGEKNDILQQSLTSHQKEINDLQDELTFLKGEINRLEEEKKDLTLENDFIVFGDGGHLLPGSVARAFMKSGKE